MGCDSNSPGKPQIDWDDPAAKDALVSALVNDANALVRALEGQDLDEQAASAVALLALVAGQDAGLAEGSDGTGGRWRIARKVAGDRVISTVDPEARHTRKSPEATGHQLVIKPGPLKPAVGGGFTKDDFTVDEAAGTVTCPAGAKR